MTRYEYQTVGANNETCDGWCVVKYADNCHPQKIGEGMTRSEAATFAAAPDILAALKNCIEIMQRAFPNGLPIQPGTLCEEQDWNSTVRQSVSAIRKAEGKQ